MVIAQLLLHCKVMVRYTKVYEMSIAVREIMCDPVRFDAFNIISSSFHRVSLYYDMPCARLFLGARPDGQPRQLHHGRQYTI